ncbi:MAG: hypothetical protein ABSB87_07880 [Terriglobales bacterium]
MVPKRESDGRIEKLMNQTELVHSYESNLITGIGAVVAPSALALPTES